ncbi:MAG: hypothetical protein ACRD43_14815, partial [Pyrinomonadaceae bacterium]
MKKYIFSSGLIVASALYVFLSNQNSIAVILPPIPAGTTENKAPALASGGSSLPAPSPTAAPPTEKTPTPTPAPVPTPTPKP